jgi:hypothetical protein
MQDPRRPRFSWEHVFVTSQGSPHARFRRALATGNPTIAWAAATELPHVALADALALCLLLVDVDRPRYERAVVRWHGRLCTEVRGISLEEAQLALAALHALPAGGAEALAHMCEAHGQRAIVEVIDGWLASRAS